MEGTFNQCSVSSRWARPRTRRPSRRRDRNFRRSPSPSTSAEDTCPVLELPDDVFYLIFQYVGPETLCRLCQVCQRFRQLASQDLVWLQHEKHRTVLRSHNTRFLHGLKEQYRVGLNWETGHRREAWLLKHNYRLLPWLQKEESTLWVSRGSLILKFDVKENGRVREAVEGPLYGLQSDVTRFVVSNGLVVSGCRGGGVSVWEASSGVQLLNYPEAHYSDTQCVGVTNDVIVSGSKDHTVKVLSLIPDDEVIMKKCFNIGDRVWSLAVSPSSSAVAVGTACYNNPAIVLLDINRGEVLGHLGDQHKRGAGVLDLKFESPHTLLTCGHDTYLRMWDLRTQSCVSMWEDPFDSAVYCLQSDDHSAMLTGTARHGLVRLWDKRHTAHIQAYYSGEQHSPVYSLAGSWRHLHVALDMGLYFVDFSIR